MDKSMAVYNHLVSFGSKPLGTWSLLGEVDVGVFSVFDALDALDALNALDAVLDAASSAVLVVSSAFTLVVDENQPFAAFVTWISSVPSSSASKTGNPSPVALEY